MLKSQAGSMDAAASAQVRALAAASSGPDTGPAVIQATLLENLLAPNATFYRARLDTEGDPHQAGEPLDQFLKLPRIPSVPSPADLAIRFQPSALGQPGEGWAADLYLSSSGGPTPLTFQQSAVLVGQQSLPFPGGAAGPFSVAAADLDYTLREDLVFAGPRGLRMYRQSPSGRFSDVTVSMRAPQPLLSAPYAGVWPADLDADGDLDLVLAPASGPPLELRNNGDGTFTPQRPFPGVTDARGFAWVDLERSGNPDAVFLDARGGIAVFTNERGGVFRLGPQPRVPPAAAIAAADIHNDGTLDLVVLCADGSIYRVARGSDSGDWSVAKIAAWPNAPKGLRPGAAQLFLADVDNNGGLDLVASAGGRTQMWLAGPDWQFTPLPAAIAGTVYSVVDTTGDGRLDLVGVDAAGKPTAWKNQSAAGYRWLDLRPRAHPDEMMRANFTASANGGDRRINSFGIGGEMEVRAGLLYQQQIIQSPVVHFGIGTAARVDAVRIVWPNGDVRADFPPQPDFSSQLQPNTVIEEVHRLNSSCPFVWAWNGSKMAFVTDFIWSSPLGLKIDAQDTGKVAQTIDWVKIRGDQLLPRDGSYDVRITADLWETHFFDFLRLLVVDHPPGTEVWTDERFDVPPPRRSLIVTGPLHPMQRAVDDRGRDVTPIVSALDGRFLGGFGLGPYQGVTRDHWVELDLGPDAPRSGPLWLVCQGWVHPTDSSINVALGQSHYPPPQSLSIETPDAAGRWHTALRNLGFPEGKNKTILIPIQHIFQPGAPRKLRLRTNLEVYWDAIWWAAGRSLAGVYAHLLAPRSASLDFRGYSNMASAGPTSPELPESYSRCERLGERWRDLTGFYTRYGDVLPLIRKVSDRYVIMNAGDELRLQFPAAPQSAGNLRDFMLIGDGWEKDGNFNTSFSSTVLPLPSHSDPAYSTPPTTLQEDPVYLKHKQDWIRYHTRYVIPDAYLRGFAPAGTLGP